MEFLSNMRLKAKLILCFSFIMALTLITAIISLSALSRSQNVAETVDDLVAVKFSLLNDVSNSTSEIFDQALTFISNESHTKSQLDNLISNMNAANQKMQYTAKTFNTDRGYKIAESLNSYITDYQKSIVPLLRQGRAAEALDYYVANIMPKATYFNVTIGHANKDWLNIIQTNSSDLKDNSNFIIIVVITIISLLFSVLVTIFVSNYIARSIAHLVKVANTIATNDLTVKINSFGRDEFNDLAQAMTTMRDDLANTVKHVIQVSNDLKNDLDAMSEQSNAVANLSQKAESQALTVAAASDEMVSTTAEIAKNCEKAAQLSDTSHRITSDSMEQVRMSLTDIKEQSSRTREDGDKIQKLAEKMQEIGYIVRTIDDIAAQTNLLALNAAIEAARAGDAGRGFAVVADEVRALASRTSKSTQEISNMVQILQNDANNASDSMNNSVENMNAVAERASQIEVTLNDVLEHVNSVNGQVTQIATAAEEQTTATAEISSNMQNITQGSQEIALMSEDALQKGDVAKSTLDSVLSDLSRFRI